MTSAVIVSTARTPLAKSWKGSFNMTHGATLGGHAVEHAIQRAGIEAGEVGLTVRRERTRLGGNDRDVDRGEFFAAGSGIDTGGTARQ